VDVLLNAGLIAMKPKVGNEILYEEIKELVHQIKNILLE
jgi:hypothetical protein